MFQSPLRYLEGPNTNRDGSEKHFVVIGAGIAGLVSAYLTLEAGHKVEFLSIQFEIVLAFSLQVTMLESSNRVGGRIWTHYGKGWYGDLGAMRFPKAQEILAGVSFKIF